MVKAFDAISGLRSDGCAVMAQDVQNNRQFDYSVYNNYDVYCTAGARDQAKQFGLDNNRLIRDGYEPLACDIDKESALEKSEITHLRGRIELCPRVFQDGPWLGRGMSHPDAETRLQMGEYQYQQRMCASNVECGIDRFDPLIPCIRQTIANPSNLVSEFDTAARIGEPTRDVEFQKKFLKQLGYDYSGKYWVKKYCGGEPQQQQQPRSARGRS